MTPILPPDPLRRLAWLKRGPIKCTADFPNFRAGVDYYVRPQLVSVRWKEEKTTSVGEIQMVEFRGLEYAFAIRGEDGLEAWFCENRLGRHVEIKQITEKDHSFKELVEHFEIPPVLSLSEKQTAEYEAAKERIRCLTQ
jgi:hypothetical protein